MAMRIAACGLCPAIHYVDLGLKSGLEGEFLSGLLLFVLPMPVAMGDGMLEV